MRWIVILRHLQWWCYPSVVTEPVITLSDSVYKIGSHCIKKYWYGSHVRSYWPWTMSSDSVMRKSTFDTSDCQLIDDYWQPVNVIKKGTHAIILIVNHITTPEKKQIKCSFVILGIYLKCISLSMCYGYRKATNNFALTLYTDEDIWKLLDIWPLRHIIIHNRHFVGHESRLTYLVKGSTHQLIFTLNNTYSVMWTNGVDTNQLYDCLW